MKFKRIDLFLDRPGRAAVLTLAVLGFSQQVFSQQADPKKTPVAIMEFTTKGGVTQQQMDALGDLLAETVRKMGQYRVIGSNDIASVLKAEERRVLSGCSEVSCMAEIGGALGVRWMVVGNVSKFGKAFLLNVKLIDAEEVKVVGSASEKISGGEEALLDAVPDVAKKVFKEGQTAMFPPALKKPPEKKPESQAVAAAENKPEKPAAAAPEPPSVVTAAKVLPPMSAQKRWGHISFWSGLGLLALGGAGLGLGKAAADDYSKGDMDAWQKSRTWTGVGFASAGLGVAMVVTGVVLWLLDPYRPRSDVRAGAWIAPDGRGAALGMAGSF